MNVFDLEAQLKLNIDEFAEKLEKAQSDTTTFQQKLTEIQDSYNNAGGGLSGFASAATTAWKAFSSAIDTTAIGSAVTVVVDKFKEAADATAEYGDNVEKSSQKMGMSTDAYQKWSYVLQQSGTSIDAMQTGMKTLATAAETGNSAFTTLGITQEQLKSLNQEQLFEKTISSLQNVSDTTERTYLASQLLGKGATDLGALLNKSASETDALKQKAEDLGDVMSEEDVKASAEYADSMEDLEDAMTGVRNNIMSSFMPSLSKITEAVADFMSGNDLTEGMNDMADGISSFFSSFIEKLPSLLVKAVKGFGAVGIAIVEGIVKGIADSVAKVVTGFTNIWSTVISKARTEGWGGLAQEIVNKIISGISSFGSNIWKTFQSIFSNVTGNIKKVNWAEAAKALIDSFINGLKAEQTMIWTTFQTLLETVANQIKQVDWQSVGKTLWNSLVNGVKAIGSTLWDIIKSFFDSTANNADGTDWTPSGTHIIQSIVSGVSSLASAIWDALWGILQGVLSSASQVNWLDVGTKIINDIVSGVGEIGSDIWTALQNLFNQVMSDLSNIDWISIGENIINGICSGIANLGENIWNTLSGYASEALDNIKSFFGISSPSKVFKEEIGAQLMAGMTLGISSGETGTTAQISKSVSNVMDSARKGISNLSVPVSATGEYSANITQKVKSTSAADQSSNMNQVLTLLNKYLPDMANSQVYLDKDTVVGAITADVDKKLGKILIRKNRGV